MKVDLNGLAGSALESIHTPQRTPEDTTATSPSAVDSAAGEDAATLSVDGARVNSLVAKALDAPQVRQDKVDALRQAIQSGEYKVDPSQIADAMIRQS